MAAPRREVKAQRIHRPLLPLRGAGYPGGHGGPRLPAGVHRRFPGARRRVFLPGPGLRAPLPRPPRRQPRPPRPRLRPRYRRPRPHHRGGGAAGAAGGGPGGPRPHHPLGRVLLPGSPPATPPALPGGVLLRAAGHCHLCQRGPGGDGGPGPPIFWPSVAPTTALWVAPPPPHPPRFVPPGGTPCAGDPPLVAAARRAFPCKEAALGAYAGAYAGLYVTLAWRGGGSRLAKPAAVLGFAAPPFLLGALRVAEHRNHWGDVLAGFLTGTAIAAFLVTCVVGNFQSTGESGQGVGGGVPRAPPELPHPQPPLEEISVTQARRADFPAVT